MNTEKDTGTTDKEAENLHTDEDLKKFLHDNKDILNRRYCDWLYQKQEEYNKEKRKDTNYVKEELYERACLSRAHFFAIRNGTKSPSREAVIKLGLALELSLEELNRSLKLAGWKPLHSKMTDDVVIIYGINNKLDIYEIDQKLKTRGAKMVLIDLHDEYATWLDKKYKEYKDKKNAEKSSLGKHIEEDLYNKACMSRNLFEQILDGKKPSREEAIKLGLALELSLEELNSSLKLAGRRGLDSKKTDDLIIIWGINSKKSIYEINQRLKTESAKMVLIDACDEAGCSK